MRKNSAGFTLIELTIVILLCAVLAALTGAHLHFLNRMIVRAELENLYVTCSVLQRSALLKGAQEKLTIDPLHQRYAYQKSSYKLPSLVQFGSVAGAKGPPGSPTSVITNPITFKDNSIIFYPDGIIQPGALYLTDRARQCAYALSCAVSKVSYLRKYRYTTVWEPL